jgi:putative transposase
MRRRSQAQRTARKGRSGSPGLTRDLADAGQRYDPKTVAESMRRQGLLCSMSAKRCCYDNACAESFFHTLKVEVIHGERFATSEHMRQTIFEYIEVDHNRTRRHSANGYISPEAFEAQRVA